MGPQQYRRSQQSVLKASLVLICAVSAFVAVAAEGSLTNGEESPVSAAEIELAQQLGVKPKVLLSASRLANRQPVEIVHLLQVNPSATLTETGAIVFGCSLHPEADGAHEHVHPHVAASSPVAPAKPVVGNQQQQHQQQQQLQQLKHPSALQPAPLPPAKGQAVWDETDLKKAFKLHSRPTANKKVFLEFKGCVTEGTDGWNKYYGVNKITTPPFDTDNNTESFSNQELSDIIIIHGAVAEAFSPWEVDVTTEDPGFEGLERADEADTHYGIRMCVGGDSLWTKTSIGGIATLNSFGWINKPGGEVYRDSFVFSKMLVEKDGSLNLGYIWKSIVHEIGHTLGLVHKGFKLPDGKSQEYYTIPPNPDMWSPIMGVPGKGLFVQWSNGEYPPGIESSNLDDELSIIAQTVPLTPDEGRESNSAGSTGSSNSSSANAICLCANGSSDAPVAQRRNGQVTDDTMQQTNCTTKKANPGWVTATVFGRISHPNDKDRYQMTVANTEPFEIQLTVHRNWHQTWQGGQKEKMWRVSNLRPEVAFEQKGVQVATTADTDPLTWQHNFTVTVPKPGNYTFAVRPTKALDSKGHSLHTTYGNLGSYQLTATWLRG